MTTTFDRLCAILARDYKLQADQLMPGTPLESLGIDSLGIADLLFNVEDEFGISLPPEPVQLLTIGDVARFIDGLLAIRNGANGAPLQAGLLEAAPSPATPLP
jgi:acyl carrier protein